MQLTFPEQLLAVHQSLLAQQSMLETVSKLYAQTLGSGGVIHVYANGHSRIAVEEMCIRMGALTGFKSILSTGLTSFTDVIGPNGIRVNQFFEKVENSGAELLKEIDFSENDILLVITATGTTAAAVDIAIEFTKRYPSLPLVAISCKAQSKDAIPKHSSGKNLWHVVEDFPNGYFLDNGMPVGDLSINYVGKMDTYKVCPLSSIGALSVVQSLNELTIKELDSRGIAHPVLKNMHLNNTGVNYDTWLRDQRKRYAKAIHNENALSPIENSDEG